jgi:hypothetical protein
MPVDRTGNDTPFDVDRDGAAKCFVRRVVGIERDRGCAAGAERRVARAVAVETEEAELVVR